MNQITTPYQPLFIVARKAGRKQLLRFLLVLVLISTTPLVVQAQQAPASAATPEVRVLQQQNTPNGVNTTLRINVRKDAFLSSRQPDTNFGSNNELRLGWSSSVYEAMRLIIEFDMGVIPRNAVINKAELFIYQLGVTPGGDSPMSYRAQYMRAAWEEGQVTWNNANYLGGDSLPLGHVDSGIGWKTAEVTSLVKSWYSGARANHGLIVTGDEVPANNRMREFAAREQSGSAPYILIDYTVACDTSAPAASVDPLPAFSPGTFEVTWRGTDGAPSGCQASGIAAYDVDYRINGGGWHRWKSQTTATANAFKNWAENNDLVELRVRAIDHVGNVQAFGNPQASTRIDTEPPSVTVTPLPATTHTRFFTLAWGGTDHLSGINHYDVQWRENGGVWEMLLEETKQTSYQITGAQNGVTYEFRLRATDGAGNSDEWPNTPQTFTTISANPVATAIPFNPGIIKPTAPVTTSFVLNWSVAAPAGVPVSSYDIYYQYNDGPWQKWQTVATTQLSVQVPYQQLGAGDGLYGFEVIAIDSTGQREPQRFKAEAAMLVDLADAVQPGSYLPVIINSSNTVVAQ